MTGQRPAHLWSRPSMMQQRRILGRSPTAPVWPGGHQGRDAAGARLTLQATPSAGNDAFFWKPLEAATRQTSQKVGPPARFSNDLDARCSRRADQAKRQRHGSAGPQPEGGGKVTTLRTCGGRVPENNAPRPPSPAAPRQVESLDSLRCSTLVD